MKTPQKENRNAGLPAFTAMMRTDPNTSSLFIWGWKQEKLRPQENWENHLHLTFPSIERARVRIWRSVLAPFLGQAKDSLWSIDLFRCESLSLRTH